MIASVAIVLAAVVVRVEAQETRSAAASKAGGEIATDIERRFGYDPNVNAFAVTIVVRDGVVKLNGRVVNDAVEKRAQTLAAEVHGVPHLQNELSVDAGARGRPGGAGSIRRQYRVATSQRRPRSRRCCIVTVRSKCSRTT